MSTDEPDTDAAPAPDAEPGLDMDYLHEHYYVDNPVSAREAIEDEIRPLFEEYVLQHTGGDFEEFRLITARLYCEWALEHVEEINRYGNQSMIHDHPYAIAAEDDLRDIVSNLD